MEPLKTSPSQDLPPPSLPLFLTPALPLPIFHCPHPSFLGLPPSPPISLSLAPLTLPPPCPPAPLIPAPPILPPLLPLLPPPRAEIVLTHLT